jgi:dienelactone hydrolase
MGQRVEFPSNAHTCQGYFASPSTGKGPAIVVIQEWWGLVPHIEDLVDRFAKQGFAAVAPDLYHGKVTRSPDEAAKLKMELDVERAEREIAGAGDWLLKQSECSSKTYGVVGFCMGGGLAQYTATKEKNVGATVSFYADSRRRRSTGGPSALLSFLSIVRTTQAIPRSKASSSRSNSRKWERVSRSSSIRGRTTPSSTTHAKRSTSLMRRRTRGSGRSIFSA